MEIYSTVLWHLHAEVQLSTLSQDLVAEDRNSPAAWCATGNLFSAQTEHETAIKFFQRAIQVSLQHYLFLYYLLKEINSMILIVPIFMTRSILVFHMLTHSLVTSMSLLRN